MMKKKSAAVFPVFSDTIAIIRYLYSQSEEYDIVELLSPSGCGLCGMDAGYADNLSHLGKTVVDYKNSRFEGWDCLILLNHAHHERDGYEVSYKGVLGKAKTLGKRIIAYPEIVTASIKEREAAESNLTFLQWLSHPNYTNMNVLDQYVSHEMRYPNVVTVLVGELIDDHSGISPFLNLYHALSKYAKTVLITTENNLCTCGAISLQPVLRNGGLSERQKILYMNKAVCDIYDNINPDVVLIYVDNPIFAYSDRIYGDFGVSMYMLTQAISVDYFVTTIPVSFFDITYINELAKQTANSYGIPIDFASISNTFVDDVVSPNVVYTPVCHTDYNNVRSILQNCNYEDFSISLGDLTSGANLNECIDSIRAIINDKKTGPIVF